MKQVISNPFEILETRLMQVQSIVEELAKVKKETSLQLVDKPEYLTRDQVAKMFAVSTVTIWDWSRKGVLKAYRIGNKVRYLKSEVLLCPRPIYDTKEGANHV
ncbi:helix-turn-helix domain-containing protein [Arcicella rigui]|uniref:Helix-turn-helix domain-containing protein n=1 Tax=Arcicella rigui TaxID=797020 RepID=A0ABU5QAF3_9BACT|nr:helix-turn-helix domain-containing protein [Arcicella rigui]MEA5139830.1 helix-turn-helix domain-containing protein [Arcicella rigui]